ncbi:phenoloxidase-activating factor 2-like isoform X6 [Pieris napi]|uniref:phenoloxidase-activating factor 2-like isoform X6 n=1 Tax=Pieris napi TaxID=78633 RepID=UPI001FB9A706|nr:phenoloxidase-activating factor 2-like isoform X6 [Pieris napi]
MRFLLLCSVVGMAAGMTPFLNTDGTHGVPGNPFRVSDFIRNRSGYCKTDQQVLGRCVKISECAEKDDGVDRSKPIFYRPCFLPEKCCPLNEVIITTAAKTNVCGYSNPSSYGFGEYPWMVAIIRKDLDSTHYVRVYLGAGVLIHKSVVMSAAHTFYNMNANQLKCRAGDMVTQTTNETCGTSDRERDVKDIERHPYLDQSKFRNNVALLILQTPFDLSVANIGTACLESQMPPPGTDCYSMGWGLNNAEFAFNVKKTSLFLLDNYVCISTFYMFKMAYDINDYMTCLGQTFTHCKGEGGSPLICSIPSSKGTRYAVVGLAIVTKKCDVNYFPVIVTKVPEVYSWIEYIMKTNYFDTTSFKYLT